MEDLKNQLKAEIKETFLSDLEREKIKQEVFLELKNELIPNFFVRNSLITFSLVSIVLVLLFRVIFS